MAKEKDPKDAKSKQGAKPKPDVMPQQKAPKKEKAAAGAAPVSQGKEEKGPTPRLAVHYKDKVVPDLIQKFGYKSVMQVPPIKNIPLNMGVGEPPSDKKTLDNPVADTPRIAGQKPVVTKARRSV